LNGSPSLDRVEHDGDPGDHDERTSDETQPRHTLRHQLGSVHQVAQDHAVRETREEAWPDEERSVIERDEHVPENGSRGRRGLLPHQQEGEGADDADGDEHGLHETGRHVADSSHLALTLEDRVRHHSGGDVGDDEEDLQRGARRNARGGISAVPGDQTGGLQHLGVADEVRRDRGEERARKNQPKTRPIA
jgi:hypothetical protein